MIKPGSLREALITANPHMQTDPDHLAIFIDSGEIRAKLGTVTGWRYHYMLHIVICDYAGHPDSLVAPLLAWVARHQPDLLQDPEKNKISFEVEILSDRTYDMLIKLPLSESVILSKKDGLTVATHKPEPVVPGMEEYIGGWDLFVNGVATEWPIKNTDEFLQ